MFIRFDVIHERDRRTDGRMDRQTDRQTLHDSKDRAYSSHRAVKMLHNRWRPGRWLSLRHFHRPTISPPGDAVTEERSSGKGGRGDLAETGGGFLHRITGSMDAHEFG